MTTPYQIGERIAVIARLCDFTHLPSWYPEDAFYKKEVMESGFSPDEPAPAEWKLLAGALSNMANISDRRKKQLLSLLARLGGKVMLIDGYPPSVLELHARSLFIDFFCLDGRMVTPTEGDAINDINFHKILKAPIGCLSTYGMPFDKYTEAIEKTLSVAEKDEKIDRIVTLAEAGEDWDKVLFPVIGVTQRRVAELQEQIQNRPQQDDNVTILSS